MYVYIYIYIYLYMYIHTLTYVFFWYFIWTWYSMISQLEFLYFRQMLQAWHGTLRCSFGTWKPTTRPGHDKAVWKPSLLGRSSASGTLLLLYCLNSLILTICSVRKMLQDSPCERRRQGRWWFIERCSTGYCVTFLVQVTIERFFSRSDLHS